MKSHIGSHNVVEFPLPEPWLFVDGQHRLAAIEMADGDFRRGICFGVLFALPIWGAVIAAWWILR